MTSQNLNLNELHEAYVKDPLLVDEFASALRIFVIKIVKYDCSNQTSFSTLEDAIGESLLEVWRALGSFNPEKAQFTTWVRMIVRRNMVDIFRKYNKRQEIELNDETANTSLCRVHRGLDSRLLANDLVGTLGDMDKSFIQMKLAGLSEVELDTSFGRKPGWANDKWRYLKKRLRFLNDSNESCV